MTDIECAYNADCLPVLRRSRPSANDEFAECQPNRYFPHCDAVTGAVQELLAPGSRLCDGNEERVEVIHDRESQGKSLRGH